MAVNTKPGATKTPTATAAQPAASASGSGKRSAKRPRVTGSDAVILNEVGTVSVKDIPKEIRYRGTRDNPFDALLTKSYEDDDEDRDTYRSFNTKTDAVEAQVRLIRGSANYLEIGSKIFVKDNPDGTSTVYFRAQERRLRPRKAKTTSTTAK